MNKQGAITDILVWLVIAFITVVILASLLVGFGLVYGTLVDASKQNQGGLINLTQPVEDTFGQVNSALPILGTIAFVIIFTLAISIFVSNFLIKAHPVFFVAYVLVSIVAIVVSVPVSNVYEGLMTNDLIGDTLMSWSASSWVMLELPLIVTIIALLGAIFLFIGTIRDPGAGGDVF